MGGGAAHTARDACRSAHARSAQGGPALAAGGPRARGRRGRDATRRRVRALWRVEPPPARRALPPPALHRLRGPGQARRAHGPCWAAGCSLWRGFVGLILAFASGHALPVPARRECMGSRWPGPAIGWVRAVRAPRGTALHAMQPAGATSLACGDARHAARRCGGACEVALHANGTSEASSSWCCRTAGFAPKP